MKLTKTTQKLDNNICKALTIACEESLHTIEGFCWLTHRANYTNFPASLVVTCVFETQRDIENIKESPLATSFKKNIQKQLLKVGVIIKNMDKNIHFDSEEACEIQHQGQWDERLKLSISKQKPTKSNRFKH
ncbi:Fis family transcriptional regulator [Colwelliaceae bacterium 6441]